MLMIIYLLGPPVIICLATFYIYKYIFRIEGKQLDRYQIAYMLLFDSCVAIFLVSGFTIIFGTYSVGSFLAIFMIYPPMLLLLTLVMIVTILITLCCARSERLLIFLSIATMLYLLFVWPPLFPFFDEKHYKYHIMTWEIASFFSFGYSAMCILLIISRVKQKKKDGEQPPAKSR